MHKSTIFVSCGQRTTEEKQLGAAISELVSAAGPFIPFFAEEQSDLNGLHENIMDALERASGFIAVMHPRGEVIVSGQTAPLLTRASVWVEQEIAIAAFINRGRGKKIPTAVYCHRDVGREGMRELLHLNPVVFEIDGEILGHLKTRLSAWNVNESKHTNGELSLRAVPRYDANVGRIVALTPMFSNEGARANEWSCTMHVPSLLIRDPGVNILAIPSKKQGYKAFQMSEAHKSGAPILNGATMEFMLVDGSITELTSAQRATLADFPILISAQIGDRLYSARVPVADAFPGIAVQTI